MSATQSAPILAAKWQDDHDNNDDNGVDNYDIGVNNDDTNDDNDDEARRRCKLFLCKPSRHAIGSLTDAVKRPESGRLTDDDDYDDISDRDYYVMLIIMVTMTMIDM